MGRSLAVVVGVRAKRGRRAFSKGSFANQQRGKVGNPDTSPIGMAEPRASNSWLQHNLSHSYMC
jgi:hypothetical protein